MDNLSKNTIAIQKYIIYEDNDIIALNKPEGILSIPDGYKKYLPNLKDSLVSIYGSIWAVHRLDKLTSGVILFSKNKLMHKKLNFQFQTRKIKKKYAAIVHGFPFWTKFIIDLPLLINGDRQHRTVVNSKLGKKAVTDVQVVNKYDMFTFVRLYPKSGYSHQIRCHLSAIGHPIIGDKLYSFLRYKYSSDKRYKQRLFLHAESITFHTATDTLISISSPLPDAFRFYLKNNF